MSPHIRYFYNLVELLTRLLHAPEKRLREAYGQLKKRGIPLASNQVNYSLIYRAPEENGVKAACDELGVTLIAYSPIAQGMSPILIFHFLDLLTVCTVLC